ncbi:GNAT family N-acetyltransferase [Pistricoccus aurantiacus]|uniref:GNAT family N-acetyltransferase n=1 Tax=Pistricoccus aurantiacus TaxID=1883414 RepID=UPI003633920B
MSHKLRTMAVEGSDIAPWLEDIAALRIRIFRDFPYLYDGSYDYEREYLRTYAESDTAVCVLALDGDRVVGASTGMAMADETEEFRKPLEETGHDTGSIFYCAESVLLPECRGRGLYRAFFDGREAHARKSGKRMSVFCAVERPENHPLRPAGYQSLDPIWRRFGYQPMAGVSARFCWKDIDQAQETEKRLAFYQKWL